MTDRQPLELAHVIKDLREELAKAIHEGKGKDLRLGLESVELELKLGVTRSSEGKAGVKFWVLDADASTKDAREATQVIKLRLRPFNLDPEIGRRSDVEMSDLVSHRPK